MPAFEAIASTTLSSNAADVTFSSVPSTYKDLQLRMYTRDQTNSAGPVGVYLQFNSSGGTNYCNQSLRANGSTVFGGGTVDVGQVQVGEIPGSTYTASIFAAHVIDLVDYASTNKYKTVRSLGGYQARIGFRTGIWKNTSAISTVYIFSDGGFVAGSVFALYGIRSS